MSEELSNLTRIAKSAIIENVFSKRRKEVNEMKPSKLLGVLMASILTLGITSAIVYYDNINKKNEIVLAESLMDPATMNDKMVDNEITSTPEVEVKEERIEVYEGMTYDELVDIFIFNVCYKTIYTFFKSIIGSITTTSFTFLSSDIITCL